MLVRLSFMRIIHVSDNCFPGETNHFLGASTRLLKERGHRVSIISSTAMLDRFSRGSEKFPVPIKRCRGIILSGRNIYPGLVFEVLFRKNPDIYHSYVLGHFATFILGYLKPIKRYPLVVEADFNAEEPKPSALKRIYTYFYREIPAKMADVLTTYTGEQKKEIIKRFGLDENKVEVLPIGVDFKELSSKPKKDMRKKFGLKKKFVILNVSRVLPQKNIKMILSALAKLRDRKAVFIHIGPVRDREYDKALKRFARENNIFGNVMFFEYLPRSELLEFYKCADAYVQASRTESFGITVVEAMAAGIPVLTTDVGVAREIINDGKNGFIIKSENDIAEKIALLSENKKLRKRIGTKGQESVRAFGWEKIIGRLEKIYRRVSA